MTAMKSGFFFWLGLFDIHIVIYFLSILFDNGVKVSKFVRMIYLNKL